LSARAPAAAIALYFRQLGVMTIAGRGTHARTARLRGVVNPTLTVALNARLAVAISLRLDSQVMPEFAAVLVARLIAGLNVELGSSMMAALNSPV